MMAGFEYLSARSLMMQSLYPTGLASAARALEINLKIILYKKKGTTPSRLKKMSHNLNKLIKRADITLDPTGNKLVEDLNLSYENRYPDNWDEVVTWKNWINEIDKIMLLAHNHAWSLLDAEEKNLIKNQNILLMAKRNSDLALSGEQEFGSMSLSAVFKRSNNHWRSFNFD